MAGKSSEGFTKSAQNVKFIRNRDIKMKDSELRREAHIQKQMSEGICDKCREKVQWRFKFDKYKPLTKPGTCQACKNKMVHKAYRSLCDPCSIKRGACPACCKDLEASNAERKLSLEEKGKGGAGAGEGEGEGDGEGEDDDGMEEEDDDIEALKRKFASAADSGAQRTMDTEKPDRELLKLASTKYSKSRVPGSEADHVFMMSVPAAADEEEEEEEEGEEGEGEGEGEGDEEEG